jgi:hypothetical protein
VNHTPVIRQPRFRIPVDILENLKESGNYLLPPSPDVRKKVFGKRTAVPVQTRKKLLDFHLDFNSELSE